VVAYIENVVKMWLGRVVITEKLEYSNDRSIISHHELTYFMYFIYFRSYEIFMVLVTIYSNCNRNVRSRNSFANQECGNKI
jgi:hypothetical protein